MNKLNQVRIIKALTISTESIEKGTPLYNIEREFQEWVKLHAEFLLERYEKQQLDHFYTPDERKNARLGLCGQKAFELLLQIMEIPYVPNDPIIDQRLQKDYDFLIPKLGKIEVKTIPHYGKKVPVKISEWHGNDFLIAWQMTENEDTIKMIGWLTREQVEAYPITPKGKTKFNPHTDSYIIDVTELNPSETLIKTLKKAKNEIFS